MNTINAERRSATWPSEPSSTDMSTLATAHIPANTATADMADAKRQCRRNRYSVWCERDQTTVPLSDTVYDSCATLKGCDEHAAACSDETVIRPTPAVTAAGVELLETLLVISEHANIRTATNADLQLCIEAHNLARFLGVAEVETAVFKLLLRFLQSTSIEDLYFLLEFSPGSIPVQDVRDTAERLCERNE